jgi:TRAP-type uncharacterized transport system fused permease subunit
MFVAFIVLVFATGNYDNIWQYLWGAITEPTLYVIIVFVISASLLAKTTVIDDCIAMIISFFGRLPGGAGFVAIIGSAYMGSLSGSGPGNVATTGVFTIPAMIKGGFPPHLAANVEAHSSTMGNMIPPAGMIAIAFSALDTLYPETYTISQFWSVLWCIALWFILQRIITMMLMCRHYKVKPMDKEDLPDFWQTVKRGWRAFFLPVIVFLPFLLTNQFGDFFVARLGEAGNKAFSNSILLFLPSLIVVAAIFLSDKSFQKKMTLPAMHGYIQKGMKSLVPTSALVLFAYCLSNVFVDIKLEADLGSLISGLNLPLFALVLILPLFTALLGCLIPGSTQVKIFGGVIISILAAAGGNPLIAAGMLPCICGAMHGVTPPYCTCVYLAMGIADAELKPTIKNNLIWILIHYVLSVLVLMGWLPLWGLA